MKDHVVTVRNDDGDALYSRPVSELPTQLIQRALAQPSLFTNVPANIALEDVLERFRIELDIRALEGRL